MSRLMIMQQEISALILTDTAAATPKRATAPNETASNQRRTSDDTAIGIRSCKD
jgi:hypothetical protein